MKLRVLMVTHNRHDYTKLSLQRLCETVPADARITVWDNASSQEMIEVLKAFEDRPQIERIIYNKTNEKLWGPTNWFWENTKDAEFLSKVDDDGLMPEKWVETLTQAHHDIPQAGILGTWRFMDEDFYPDLAIRKIQSFGAHQLMRSCWVEGSGYIMKRSVVDKIGPLTPGESFTAYGIRAAAADYINGWYYPFLYQEHMDDPRAAHSAMKTEADFHRLKPLSATTFNIATREQWIALNKDLARRVQASSFNPRDYLGWRARGKRALYRLLGRSYMPRT